MKSGFKLLSVFVVCIGLIAGCSSSDSPSPIPDPSVDAGTADAGTADAGTADAGTADAGNGTIDLNGDYDVSVLLNDASSVVPECSPLSGMLTVTGTTISGLVDDRITVTGSIATDGSISGGFAIEGGSKVADYDGMLDGEALAGMWSDIFGCSGTWRAVKTLVN